MLPKAHRIRKTREFDLIRAEGVKHKAPHFMFVVRKLEESQKNPEYKYPRFGFIVTKKIGKAVVRNKVKRWLREAVRLVLPTLPTNFEATVVGFEGIEKSNFAELHKELIQVLKNI